MEQDRKHCHYSCYLLPAYEIYASSEVKENLLYLNNFNREKFPFMELKK